MENTSSRLAQNVGEHRTSLEVGFLQQFVQAIDQARVLLAQRQAVAADLFVLLSICVVPEEAGHHKTFVVVHSTTGLIQDLHTSHPPSLISQSIMGERSPTGCLPMGIFSSTCSPTRGDMWRCNSTPTNIFLIKFRCLISKNSVLRLGSFYLQVYPVSFVVVPRRGMPLFKTSPSDFSRSSSRACCPHSRSSWAICSFACCGRSTSGGL